MEWTQMIVFETRFSKAPNINTPNRKTKIITALVKYTYFHLFKMHSV